MTTVSSSSSSSSTTGGAAGNDVSSTADFPTPNNTDTSVNKSCCSSSSSVGYEYLDHTADIQLHSYAPSLEVALSTICRAMFDYITDINRVKINDTYTHTYRIEGYDVYQLLYNVMDEMLFQFSTEGFIPAEIEMKKLKRGSVTKLDHHDDIDKSGGMDNDNDNDNKGEEENQVNEPWELEVTCRGELFDMERHTQGTEIKAITYSNMQITETADRTDIYVIVDI